MTSDTIGEPIPRGVIAYPVQSASPEMQETAPENHKQAWSQLAEIGFTLAFLPALAWASFVTTGTTVWQSWAFPGFPKGDPTRVSNFSSVDS